MRLNISKYKNAEQLYIIKSIRINKKSTTKIVAKLGSMDSLLPKFDNDRNKVVEWANNEATRLTNLEKDECLNVTVNFSEEKKRLKDKKSNFNIGYLFPSYIYHELGLNKICKEISTKHNISFNLSDILNMLVCTRIISPCSKLSSYDYSFKFLEKPSYNLHHVYRGLDVLSNHIDEIQAKLYENSKNIINRNKSVLFYDCTNYYFEIEQSRGFAQYVKSKENSPNPIVQMGLFLDANGYPLCFSTFPGNQNEQPTLKPLEKKIIKDFNISEFIVCTNAGLCSNENRKFNSINNRSYIVTQSLKTVKKYIFEWAIDPTGWKMKGSTKKININEIDESLHEDTTFFKERCIIENGIEQRLIITYSIKYENYQKSIRAKQIERAEKIISNPSKYEAKTQNSQKRFIEQTSVTANGEIGDKKILKLEK